MSRDSMQRPPVRRGVLAALLAVVLTCATASQAAQPNESTTLRECYKSIRSCQKSRCGRLDGQAQLTCMQQCNREYETCASGAASSGSALGMPQKNVTPGTPGKQRHRNMHRDQSQGDQN